LKSPRRNEPKPGQESVWDYPRPPRLEPAGQRVRIRLGDVWIADSEQAWRILETSHPPTIYIPQADIRMEYLIPVSGLSFCEWKGAASYFDVAVDGDQRPRSAWTYASPATRYAALAGTISFYPSKMDVCFLGDEQVAAQPGDFYGGWITNRIVGPFKGSPGTWGW
jgi:uncharacterized protein (DUF427 family)